MASPGEDAVVFDFSKLDLDGAPEAIVALSDDEKLDKLAEFLNYCDELKVKPRRRIYIGVAPKKGWPSANHLGKTQTWEKRIIAADEWRAKQSKAG